MTTTNNVDFASLLEGRHAFLGTGALEISRGNPASKVWISDGWLRYKLGDLSRKEVDALGLLDELIAIQSDDDIVRFVEKRGPIGFCPHALPAEHDGEGVRLSTLNGWEPEKLPDGLTYPFQAWSRRGPCRPGWVPYPDDDVYSEPVERYHYFSGQARAVLRCAVALHRDELGNAADWDRLGVSDPGEMSFRIGSDLDASGGWGWTVLLKSVNEWLQIGDVRPALAWSANGPGFHFNPTPFGTLAVQLMLAVSRSHDMAVCHECKVPYFRNERAPRAGYRNFCNNCGIRAAWKHAKRDQRSGKSTSRKPSKKKE